MKTKLVILLLFHLSINSNAQTNFNPGRLLHLVTKNYPLSKQSGLLKQKANYEIEALSKGKLPRIDVNAQATYQSEVIGFPAALPGVQPLNKDQYRATLDINQLIYNGGVIDANAKLKEAQTKTQQQQVEINLYQLKSRINQYYFSILLLQEKTALLSAKRSY
jgi:outer membrane protein TolC